MNYRWFKVFPSKEAAEFRIPVGKVIPVNISAVGKRIALAHSAKGFFAVFDECTHNKISFARGACNKFNEIICPWHGYRFDLATGKETTSNNCPDLDTFPVKITDEGLFIGVPEN